MIRYVRMAIAGAATLALAFAAPVPASAAPDPTWPDSASCAAGGFTGQVLEPAQGLWPMLRLSGWVGPCPPTEKDPEPRVNGRFGFAYMNFPWMPGPEQDPRGGRLYGERLREYQSADGNTLFEGYFDFQLGRSTGQLDMPICLISDLETKVACVVVREHAGDPPTVIPVDVTDRIVRGPAMFAAKGAGTTPNCGTCL